MTQPGYTSTTYVVTGEIQEGVRELCSPPSGNVESENTLSLGSAGGTIYPVLPQAVATGS